ncbi:hypothetical protein AAHA92_06358 [Salvia divinorum]|uniref:Uncharacterized protein n=1 Tax=Salvia divinorum TaxID=28513 RepID=A0ABD1I5D4_SALDI
MLCTELITPEKVDVKENFPHEPICLVERGKTTEIITLIRSKNPPRCSYDLSHSRESQHVLREEVDTPDQLETNSPKFLLSSAASDSAGGEGRGTGGSGDSTPFDLESNRDVAAAAGRRSNDDDLRDDRQGVVP